MKRTADGWIATSIRTLGDVRIVQPSTIEEAAELLAGPSSPVVLAGGTDLIAQFNEGLAPSTLLSLRRLDALRRIAISAGELRIGSCVTHFAGSGSDTARRAIPGFASAWARVANVRVRMSATIGGNVMARRTRYEMPILLGALQARVAFAGSGGGETGVLAIPEARRTGSLLTEVAIPLDGLVAFDYERSLRPIVTQAASVRRNADRSLAVRVVIGTEAAAPHGFAVETATSDLRELAANADTLSRAAYRDFPENFSDPLSSNAYLRHTGRVLLRRQLERLGHVAA